MAASTTYTLAAPHLVDPMMKIPFADLLAATHAVASSSNVVTARMSSLNPNATPWTGTKNLMDRNKIDPHTIIN